VEKNVAQKIFVDFAWLRGFAPKYLRAAERRRAAQANIERSASKGARMLIGK
jgi:hypothetical protein